MKNVIRGINFELCRWYVYRTVRRFTRSFNEDSVGRRQFKPLHQTYLAQLTVSVCTHLRRTRPTPDRSNIAYAMPRDDRNNCYYYCAATANACMPAIYKISLFDIASMRPELIQQIGWFVSFFYVWATPFSFKWNTF